MPVSRQGDRPSARTDSARPQNGVRGAQSQSARHPAASQKKSTDVAKKKSSRPRFIKSALDENDDYSSGSTAISSLLKAVVYIMAILVVSGLLSYFAITVGNDVFAFVKEDKEITVTIGADTDVKLLGKILEENGVIGHSNIFNIYAKLRKKDPALQAGEYTVSPNMSYDELISVFTKQTVSERTTVRVMIPEGYTVDQTIDLLVDKYGLSSKAELVDAIQNYDFDYWFVERLKTAELKKGRIYRLEGYLYPDTYDFYSDASAPSIINKLLNNFDNKMAGIFRKDQSVPGDNYIEKIDHLCGKYNLTFDEMVTLASMIQMEAKYSIEYGTISSVFHNRLANPSVTNGKMESCATIQYFLEERAETITAEHQAIDHPYNTYIYEGLPPGAVSSFSQTAFIYALYPETTKYYYFVAQSNGYSLFAKTYKEHLKNIEAVKNETEE